jgi:transposase InsO family protein
VFEVWLRLEKSAANFDEGIPMFSENETHEYLYVQHKLLATASDYVLECWKNPSRMVGTHAENNVISFVPSKKLNGSTYSTESRLPERAFLTLCEFDDDVICALDQPDPIQIQRTRKNGTKYWDGYTPDAVILTRNGPRVVEVKPEDVVQDFLINRAADWQRSEFGDIVYRPAQEAFAKLGLEHVVYVYKHQDRFLIENLDVILLAREHGVVELLDERHLKKLMSNTFALTLRDLMAKLRLTDITPLVLAIDRGLLAADLKQHRLIDAGNCLVSLNGDLLAHAIELCNKQRVYWDGLAESWDLKLMPRLSSAEHALKKLKKIEEEKSSRSIRRWKNQIKIGVANNLSEFQSLIPMSHLCGNRNRKIPAVVDEFLTEFLLKEFISKQGLSIYRGYKQYEDLAIESHPQFRPVSRQTFTKRLDQIPAEVIGYARGGKRMRNALAASSDPEKRALKASVAWQCAAADHYLADIYLVLFTRTNTVYIERPWVTTLIDIATSKILGISISFLPPSRRSVAKVIRDCVRRHGKLPREIIVDRGADFKSVYLASFMAHYGLILSLRPTANPKYGGEVEGFFGEFKKQWLCQRPGNLADYKEARSVDGSKAPKKAAILQPSDFYQELTAFCDWRENKCRGTSALSTAVNFTESSQQYPFFAKAIQYDAEFISVTAVEHKKYSVSYQRGINIKGTWYYSPALRKLNGRKKKADVRIDPDNPNLIFVRVENKWEPCFSSDANAYSAKCAVHQLVDGMIKHEAAGMRRKIAEQHDLELATIIRQLQEFKEQTKTTPVYEITLSEEETGEDESIFNHLTNATVRPINIQQWSA